VIGSLSLTAPRPGVAVRSLRGARWQAQARLSQSLDGLSTFLALDHNGAERDPRAAGVRG
jgi:hypothetical protein